MTGSAFDELGGVAGSVAQRAEEVYSALTGDQQTAARRAFGRLVALGEGVEDTRRRVTLTELGSSAATRDVLDEFGRARLLAFDRDPTTRTPIVELAHEALIREWPRLRRWLDDDREVLRIQRHLTLAAAGWAERDRDPGELYRGARLAGAEMLVDSDIVTLNSTEAQFLAASLERRDAEADAERHRMQRLRRLVTATAIVAVIALVAGGATLWQWNRADDQAARAETASRQADLDRLRSSAVGQVASNPTLGLLLAAEAYRIDPGIESADVVHRTLTATDGLEATMPGGYAQVGLTRDGTQAVAVSAASIDVWDLTSQSLVRTSERRLRFGTRSDISGATGLVAVSDIDGTDLVSTETGTTVFSDDREFDRLSFSGDGRELALFGRGAMEIWSLDEPESPEVIETVDEGHVNIA